MYLVIARTELVMVSQRPEVDRYLQQLARGLSPLPAAEREDIVREWSGHIDDLLASGESAETVLTRLGEPAAVAAAMVEERLVTVDQRRSPTEISQIVLRAAVGPFLGGALAFLAIIAANQVVLYARWAQQHQVPVADLAWLGLTLLPANLEIAMPTALLFVGLLGIPSLARTLSAPLFRRLLPQVSKAILAAGLGVSALCFVLQDTIVVAANRETVRLTYQLIAPKTPRPDLSPQEMSLSQARQTFADWRQQQLTGNVRPNPFGWAAQTKKWRYEIAVKMALPLMSFAMAALGVAMGFVLAGRKPMGAPFRTGLGVITIFGTYVMLFAGRSLALNSAMHPELAAWLPFIVTLAVSGLIAWAGLMRRPQGVSRAQA
jgi:lipopolysaccharide export LptBFGC system permease protein LptF